MDGIQDSLPCLVALSWRYNIPLSDSQDCIEWLQLPHVDDGLKERSSKLQGRFTGDPSYVYEHSYTHRVGEGESAQEKVTKVSLIQVMHCGNQGCVSLQLCHSGVSHLLYSSHYTSPD